MDHPLENRLVGGVTGDDADANAWVCRSSTACWFDSLGGGRDLHFAGLVAQFFGGAKPGAGGAAGADQRNQLSARHAKRIPEQHGLLT